jgi:NTP pyrophosphatase (non-canonical NTP hydrolase)
MTEELEAAVAEFMRDKIKHVFPVQLKPTSSYVTTDLLAAARLLKTVSSRFPKMPGEDPRSARAHLMVEELSELLHAMANFDPVETADGLADLAYVVQGTALTFGIPLPALLREVHRSNMTKTFDGTHHPKGPTFSPPDIAGILKRTSALQG